MSCPFENRIIKTDSCWLFRGEHNYKGYGRYKVNGKRISAHRYSYTLFTGPIPNGLHVLHRCDNPGCVNPQHLFLGTNLDNQVDRKNKGRSARGENSGQAKLTEKEVKYIRYSYKNGRQQKDLATVFNVHPAHISKICSGKKWSYLCAQ